MRFVIEENPSLMVQISNSGMRHIVLLNSVPRLTLCHVVYAIESRMWSFDTLHRPGPIVSCHGVSNVILFVPQTPYQILYYSTLSSKIFWGRAPSPDPCTAGFFKNFPSTRTHLGLSCRGHESRTWSSSTLYRAHPTVGQSTLNTDQVEMKCN